MGIIGGVGALAALVVLGMYALVPAGGGGRPLRIEGHEAPVRANVLFDKPIGRSPRANQFDPVTEARLLAHWANEASAECASIPAFLALVRDLKRAGAPTALVERALRAAREESVHTELCTTLANAYSPLPIVARVPETPASTDADLHSLLERLAAEELAELPVEPIVDDPFGGAPPPP